MRGKEEKKFILPHASAEINFFRAHIRCGIIVTSMYIWKRKIALCQEWVVSKNCNSAHRLVSGISEIRKQVSEFRNREIGAGVGNCRRIILFPDFKAFKRAELRPFQKISSSSSRWTKIWNFNISKTILDSTLACYKTLVFSSASV